VTLALPMNSRSPGLEPSFPPSARDAVALCKAALAAMSTYAEGLPQTPQTISVTGYAATPDTQQFSVVKAGLLHGDESTLISDAAKAAVGLAGLNRLQTFFQLQAGWDGPSSKPLDLSSIETFSDFFSRTRLRPEGLGVFMSAQGNLVVNWPDSDNKLIELEFHSTDIDYYVERSGEEGTVVRDEIGVNDLLGKLVTERVAA